MSCRQGRAALDDRVKDPVPHKQNLHNKTWADECVRRYVGCLAGGLFGGGYRDCGLDVGACRGFVAGEVQVGSE